MATASKPVKSPELEHSHKAPPAGPEREFDASVAMAPKQVRQATVKVVRRERGRPNPVLPEGEK
jgi:hypothetical protein